MPKAKQFKPLAVDSIEVRLNDGQTFEIKTRDVERFCSAIHCQLQAERLGKRAPKSKFDREIALLAAALIPKEGRPLLDIACTIIRSDR